MKKSKIIIESGISKSEKMKIVKVMRGTSFLNYRDGLEKHGIKVEFATSPFSYYRLTHRKWGKKNDGKERAIYITSKRNAGDDAEYISNDNIAMGELTEIVQEAMFNKMKANTEIKELVREVAQEMLPEAGKWNQATANKVADLSKIRTKTMMDLYMVMKNNPKTKKEKDAVQKLFDELKKRGELKHIKSPMDESDEVNEEMHDCIQDYMEVHGLSYSEAMKKCRGSVWDEKGGKRGKRGKRMRREDISEDEGANINVHAMSRTEIQLAIGAINFFGTGQHPFADEKGLKYFKVDYLADIIAKNKNKLEATARKHLEKLVKKLQKSTNEETINEGDDLRFVIDQLSNSMEHYDEREFVSHMSKETKYDANKLKKVFQAYWKIGAMDRFKLETDINKTKKFLAKLGIKEEVQSINEGLWSGIRTRETGVYALNGKKALQMAWGSGTSFQQILWRISPKKGHLSSDSTDADGKIKMRNYAPGWAGPAAAGLNLMYQHNKDAGLDIENDFPFKDVNRMRKAYDRLPVETQVKMAHGDHKLAMNFLAKYGIKP